LEGYFFVVLKKFAPAAWRVEVPQSSVVFATQEVADRLVRFSTPPETSLHMSSLIWRQFLDKLHFPFFLCARGQIQRSSFQLSEKDRRHVA